MSETNETKELIVEALYREMYGSCTYIEGTGGELDTSSLVATYCASDRNRPASERTTKGGAYMEIFTDDDCAAPHLCCNTDCATPEMLAAAAAFMEEYPLEYWEETARVKHDEDRSDSERYAEWEQAERDSHFEELRAIWR